MKAVTTKQDFLEACRVLSFAVSLDAFPLTVIPSGERPVRGLHKGKITRRTIDSTILLSEFYGTAAEGISVSAELLTYRDIPAVLLSVSLTNVTAQSIQLRAAFAADLEFCGSEPMVISGGQTAPVPVYEHHKPEAGKTPFHPHLIGTEEFILQTEENCLLVRSKAECCAVRTPCGAALHAGLHDITLGAGKTLALPEIFLLASAGHDQRHAEQLLKAWEQRHG